MNKKKYEYFKPSIDKKLIKIVEQFIQEYPEQGYRSVAEFIEDAIRRRADQLRIFQLIPRFSHFNTYEDHVTIIDKKLGWDKEGERQPRFIDVYIKPVGQLNHFKFWCEYCDSDKCEHVEYVLSIREKTVKPIERKGWKYVGSAP